MLEDESGRIRLIGERLKEEGLVTGVIIGVLGMETPDGEFEVADMCYAGIAPQVNFSSDERMDVDGFNCFLSSIVSWLTLLTYRHHSSASAISIREPL
jgi:DNA polymerase delta subunit 2